MTMATHFIENKSQDCLRTKAAKVALAQVLETLTPSSVIGIGTGATVEVFVQLLAESNATFSHCVSSSKRSSNALETVGIMTRPISESVSLDFYIDGIDEGLNNGMMIKGGGAALAREKILATQASTFITIADNKRLVETLGAFPLPVEILPAAKSSVANTLQLMGGSPEERRGCITDNGNIILDVAGLDMTDPRQLERCINLIPGVVENGIFSHRSADFMVFSNSDGAYCLSKK